MSHQDHAATSAVPFFTASPWDERKSLAHAQLEDIIASACVIGICIGESAHSVAALAE